MSSCEKCWRDAGGDADIYGYLIKHRVALPCTAEEQAGEYANECPWCGRKTLHQHTGEPMCGCPRSPRETIAGHSSQSQNSDDRGEKR